MTAQYNVPGGYSQCRFIWSCVGLTDPMGTTLGVFSAEGDKAAMAADISVAFISTILAAGGNMGTDWTYNGLELTTSDVGGPTVDQATASLAGTLPNPTVVANTATLVRKNTALGGRKNRGRLFIPPYGLFESEVNSAGFLNAGTITAVTGMWNAFLAALAVQSITPYLYHQYDPDLAELPEVPTEIISFACQPQVATQRLRMR